MPCNGPRLGAKTSVKRGLSTTRLRQWKIDLNAEAPQHPQRGFTGLRIKHVT
jgi:hypothetical protein